MVFGRSGVSLTALIQEDEVRERAVLITAEEQREHHRQKPWGWTGPEQQGGPGDRSRVS